MNKSSKGRKSWVHNIFQRPLRLVFIGVMHLHSDQLWLSVRIKALYTKFEGEPSSIFFSRYFKQSTMKEIFKYNQISMRVFFAFEY